MEHISANYPEEEWTQVYTDGSAIEATKKWRCATNFRAEAMTVDTAATQILANLYKTHKKVVFFSDVLSVLLFCSILGCVLPLQEVALRQSPPSFYVLAILVHTAPRCPTMSSLRLNLHPLSATPCF